ncbi:MAG TPA: sigma-70 family RNA polymerase sigma factor [Planctomycetaceae bacterium]|nr:sigma-70 family RNA polymerase sigma factor [Planctomycetaceae bacterium]
MRWLRTTRPESFVFARPLSCTPDEMMYDGGQTTELQLLLDGWAAGDVAARDRLLDRAGQRLLALTRRMLRGYPHLRRWEQTDDVFQSAVLRLYRSLGDVRPDSIGQFFGLAATQIRRTLIDLARHHFGPEGAARRHHSEGGAPHQSTAGGDSGPARADERPETLDAWARFHEAVEALPRDERDVFSVIWYGEATQKESAELLGVTERTIQRRLVRARLLLYESLKNVRACFEEADDHGS